MSWRAPPVVRPGELSLRDAQALNDFLSDICRFLGGLSAAPPLQLAQNFAGAQWSLATSAAASLNPTIQRVTLSGVASITLDPTADYLEITLSGAATLTDIVGGTPDRPLLVSILGSGLMLWGGGFQTSPSSLYAQPGTNWVLRYDGGWIVGPPNNRVLADGTDQTPNYVFQKLQQGDNVELSLVGTTDKKVRISSAGAVVVNVTDITNITNVKNSFYINETNLTLNFPLYIGGVLVWLSYCPCAVYYPRSGSGYSGYSGGPTGVYVNCCPDYPIPRNLWGHLSSSCPALDGINFQLIYGGSVGGQDHWTSGIVQYNNLDPTKTNTFDFYCDEGTGLWSINQATVSCYEFTGVPSLFDCSQPVWYFQTTVAELVSCPTCVLGQAVTLTIDDVP